MAYSAQTAHYGLPLPTGSDRSSFMDQNESFTAVDTALYNAVTQNTQTEQEVQDLNAEVAQVQSDITAIGTDIAALQNGLASTNLLVQEHSQDITNLEGGVSALVTTTEGLATDKQNKTDNSLETTSKDIVGAINEVNAAIPAAQVENLAEEYDATATYAVGDHVMHEGTYYVCSTAIAVAEAWDATHWTQEKVGDEIEAIKSAPKVRTIATSAANQTYGAQIAELKAVFDTLSQEEIERTFVEVGNYVHNIALLSGVYTFSYGGGASAILKCVRFDSAQAAYTITWTSGATTFATDTTSVNTDTMVLKIRD